MQSSNNRILPGQEAVFADARYPVSPLQVDLSSYAAPEISSSRFLRLAASTFTPGPIVDATVRDLK